MNVLSAVAIRVGSSPEEIAQKTDLDIHTLAENPSAIYLGIPIEEIEGLNAVERILLDHELRLELSKRSHWVGFVDADGGIDLRIAPTADAQVITSLPDKASVEVLYHRTQWLYIRAERGSGYVLSDSIVPQEHRTPATTKWMGNLRDLSDNHSGVDCVDDHRTYDSPTVEPHSSVAAPNHPPDTPVTSRALEQDARSTLQDLDPKLYDALQSNIQNGLQQNNILFYTVLDESRALYRKALWMYRILFLLGVSALAASFLLAYIFRSSPAMLIGAVAIMAGIAIVTFLVFFVTRPLDTLQRHHKLILWLDSVGTAKSERAIDSVTVHGYTDKSS
jgi:hypothetical protein